MKSQRLTIYIVPKDHALMELENYDVFEVGKVRSNGYIFKFNSVKNGYSIIINDVELVGLDPIKIVGKIMNTLCKNLPDTFIKTDIQYLYELADGDDDAFEVDIAEAVINLDVKFKELLRKAPPQILRYFKYETSENIEDVVETYRDILEDDGEEEDNDEDDSINPFAMFGFEEDDDDDDYEDDYPRKRKKRRHRKNDVKSKVLSGGKNPKRMYRRHGVLVARNKNAIKRDRRILKDFLKDFIPGDSQWKKDLRNELADRWMSVYAVTPKKLKRLEKKHKKLLEERRKSKIDPNKVLTLANSMVNTNYSSWYNPNK